MITPYFEIFSRRESPVCSFSLSALCPPPYQLPSSLSRLRHCPIHLARILLWASRFGSERGRTSELGSRTTSRASSPTLRKLVIAHFGTGSEALGARWFHATTGSEISVTRADMLHPLYPLLFLSPRTYGATRAPRLLPTSPTPSPPHIEKIGVVGVVPPFHSKPPHSTRVECSPEERGRVLPTWRGMSRRTTVRKIGTSLASPLSPLLEWVSRWSGSRSPPLRLCSTVWYVSCYPSSWYLPASRRGVQVSPLYVPHLLFSDVREMPSRRSIPS